MSQNITKEELKLQKELLELQVLMGKVVSKKKVASAMKRAKGVIAGEFALDLDQNIVYDILDLFADRTMKELELIDGRKD